MTNPTAPDQGDERRAFQRWEAYAKRAGFLDGNGNAYDGQQKEAQTSWFTWQACEKERDAAQPVAQPELKAVYQQGYNDAAAEFGPREPVAQEAKAGDLAALVRKLVHSLRKASPDHPLCTKAMYYLCSIGMQGSPLRDDAALSASHPSQGAEDRHNLLRLALTNIARCPNNGAPATVRAMRQTAIDALSADDALAAAPHPPVSAEAGKGEPFGYWHEGPTEDESEFFLAKDLPDNECLRCFPLYRDPSSSVAVSGEVSEDAILEAAEKVGLAKVLNPIGMQTGKVAAIGSTYMTEEIIDFANAVLALAGSGGKKP